MSGAQPMSEANALAEASAVGTQRHASAIIDYAHLPPGKVQQSKNDGNVETLHGLKSFLVSAI